MSEVNTKLERLLAAATAAEKYRGVHDEYLVQEHDEVGMAVMAEYAAALEAYTHR